MQKRKSFLTHILKELSRELDFQYVLSPQKDMFGYIEFPNKVRHFVSRFDIRINPTASHFIANDKDYTDYFLKKFHYPVVRGKFFFYGEDTSLRKLSEEALSFAQKISFPVVIKPNKSAHGIGFSVVEKASDFKKVFKKRLLEYQQVLVQEFIQGEDYRLIIYRGKCIAAYQRIPFRIQGDGVHTLEFLIEEQRAKAEKQQRRFDVSLEDVQVFLKKQKMRLSFIPQKGVPIQVLPNANISSGGSALDVSEYLHRDYKRAAMNAVRDMNLNLCGVDLIIQGDISQKPKQGKWKFLELNASPGFRGYASLGEKQYQIIMHLFRDILSDIEKKKIIL